jgi:hypothetical protein
MTEAEDNGSSEDLLKGYCFGMSRWCLNKAEVGDKNALLIGT